MKTPHTDRIRALKAQYKTSQDHLRQSKIIEEIELEFKHLKDIYKNVDTKPTPLYDIDSLIWIEDDEIDWS